MNLKIDKGIQIPESRKLSIWKPFVARMEHGDSVLMDSKKMADRLAAAIRKYGFKCRIRKQPGSKYRVWKIDPSKEVKE